jgi:hypothetical protein
MLALASAAAQPPADAERFPPAPDLPGVVVSQTAPPRPADTIGLKPIEISADDPAAKPVDQKSEIPPAVPPDAGVKATPAAACPPAGPVCKTGCCGGGCVGKITEWLTFRSRARQRGHYPSPYTPPLYAWFPCDPSRQPCGPPGAPAKVPGWPGEPPALPKPVEVGPPPAVVPPGPVGSLPLPPARPDGTIQVEPGLSFSPGGAPMAAPTTQTHLVSHWRPR